MTSPKAWKNRRSGTAVLLLWILFGMFQASGAAAAESPQILDESVSEITETSVVLEATIDPGDGAAYYQFQLGPERDELPAELLCPPDAEPPCVGNQSTAAFPIQKLEGDVQAVEFDFGAWAAAAHTNGLKPGTPYRFRVVVAPAVDREDAIEWEEPTVLGANKWFTTLGSAVPVLGPPLEEPLMAVRVPLPKCKKGMIAGADRCTCRGFPPRKVNGKVRCVKPKGASRFSLLRHPVGLAHLPLSLQVGLSQWLPPTDLSVKARLPKLRGGTVYLGEVGVYGVGSSDAICMRAWGGHSLMRSDLRGGRSACLPMRKALKRGVAVLSFCTGTDRAAQITGLVPDGVTGLGVDRFPTGEIEEVIPVKTNAFVAQLELVGVVLHGIGPRAGGFEMKFPLRQLATPPSRRCLK